MQEYTLDIPTFNRRLRELLAEVDHTDTDYDATILADRITARLVPTRKGVVSMDKDEAERRLKLAFGEVFDPGVRAGVAETTLVLLEALAQ